MRVFLTAIGAFLTLWIITGSPVIAQSPADAATLQDMWRHVYESNPGLLSARAELEERRELYPQARAGWLPSVNAESSIFATDIESSNFAAGDGATTKDVTLSLDQPVWRGGRTFAETARAKDLIKAGEAVLNRAEQDILLRAALTYLDVIRARGILALRQENEVLLTREFQAAAERYELGEATITDAHQASARLERARSEEVVAMSRLQAREAEFLALAGYAPPANMAWPTMEFPIPEQIDEMVLMAENNNPDLWIRRYEREAAEHNSDAVFRELFPQLSAFASYNRQYDPQPGIVPETETGTVGLRARVALYQGGATRSRIREARHAEERARYEVEDIRRTLRQDITTSWQNYLAARAMSRSRTAEIKAAELALQGVREEAMVGQRTVLDILDADQEVINARAALINAQRDELAARFELAATLGLLKAPQE